MKIIITIIAIILIYYCHKIITNRATGPWTKMLQLIWKDTRGKIVLIVFFAAMIILPYVIW